MQTIQLRLTRDRGWAEVAAASPDLRDARLVLVSGDRLLLEGDDVLAPLRARFPAAHVVAWSSGGEIQGDRVHDDAAIATAVRFDATGVRAVDAALGGRAESAAVGAALARLPHAGLRHVLVFAEGLDVNGSALADGLAGALPAGVTVSGGLAGDGERFARTVVGLDGPPTAGRAVAVGLYGDRLRVGTGSSGGWEAFGPSWMVTRAEGNVLLELDGQPALTIYKRHIGAHAYGLPASGLLYPLHVEGADGGAGTVRTLLAVDREAGSLTFAGDVPEGRRTTLMRAPLDRLIEAAGEAATESLAGLEGEAPQLALLVSCIGRKLLLQRRVHEEVRRAGAALGAATTVAGFYSYGELSPTTAAARCALHNQTMTITTFAER